MNQYSQFTKFMTKDNQGEVLVDLLLQASEEMERHQPCQIYLINMAKKEENIVYVYEVWSSKGAHEESLTLEFFQNLIKRAKPIIVNIEVVSTFEFVAGKGV